MTVNLHFSTPVSCSLPKYKSWVLTQCVDYEYLKSILGEYELKRSLVATPCSLRKEPSERILGMLPSLKVSIHISEDTDDNKWSVHTLSNVLVVDALPVPLHVSLKTIRVFPEDQSGMLEATSFPPQYQSHPYWNEQLRKEILYAGVNF